MNRTTTQVRSYLALMILAAAPKLMAQATPQSPAPADNEETVTLDPFSVTAAEENDGYSVKDTLAGTRVRTELKDIASSISVVNAQFLRDTGAKNSQDLLVYTTNTEVGGLGGNFSGVGNTFVQGVSETNALLRPSQNTRVRGLDSADNTRDFFTTDIPWDGYIVDRVDLQRGPNSILFGLGSPAGIVNTSINGATFKTAGKLETRYGSFGSIRNSADYNQVLLKNELSFRVTGLYDHTKYRQEPAYQKDKRLFGAVKWAPSILKFEGARTEISANIEVGDVQANRPRTLPPMDKISPWFYTGTDATNVSWHPNNGGKPLNLNKGLYDPYYVWTYGASFDAGDWRGKAPEYSNWLASYMMDGMQITANQVFAYSGTGSVPITTPYQANPNAYFGIGVFKPDNTTDSSKWYTYRDAGIGGFPFARQTGINGIYNYSKAAGLPGALTGAWKDKTLSDPTIFNFFNKLIDGPTKKEWNKWNAYNLNLKQTFLNDRLGFNVVYDHQDYKDGYSRLISQNPTISVDINAYMMDYPALVGQGVFADKGANYAYPTAETAPAGYTGLLAVKNPNAGRAFIGGSYGSGTNTSYAALRDSWRFQGTGEFRFRDVLGKGVLADMLGRHVFTGLYSLESIQTDSRNWATAALTMNYATDLGVGARLSDGARIPDWIVYLSDSLTGSSYTKASGLNLNAIGSQKQPFGTTQVKVYDSHWNSTVDPKAPWTNPALGSWDGNVSSVQAENPANYVGWKNSTYTVLNANMGDKDQLYMDGSKVKKQISSEAITYQGYWLDDVLVPTVGWRKDVLRQRAGNAPINTSTGSVSMDYDYAAGTHRTSGESTSYGAVIHTPKFIKNKMPLGTSLDIFANTSENTRVETRYGFNGELLPNTTGKTEEYGIAINTLNDKLQLKVTSYKTRVKNASIAYGETGTLGANTYYIYLLESWSLARAVTDLVSLAGGPSPSGGYTAYASVDSGWAVWDRPGILASSSTTMNKNAIKAAFKNQISQGAYDAYGFQINRSTLAGLDVDGLIAGTVPVSSLYKTVNAGTPDESTTINGISNWVYNKQGVGDIQALGKGRINGTYPMGTIDNESRGLEFELTAQPFRNWNVSVNVAKTRATRTEVGAELVNVLNEKYTKWVGANPNNYKADLFNADGSYKLTTGSQRPEWYPVDSPSWSTAPSGYFIKNADNKAAAGDLRLWWAGDKTIRAYFLENLWYPYQFQLQASRLRAEAPELNPWRANLVSNLNFDDKFLPFLKGVNVGGAVRWQQGNILGYELDSAGIALDPTKPLRGNSETNVDMWVGYGHKLTKKINWRIQLNLSNIGKHVRLVPLSMNPDKTVATSRIAEGTTFNLTNTFEF